MEIEEPTKAKSEAVPPSEPNETIYVHNLNEKIKKKTLKKSLHSVFNQFGKILKIIALRGVLLRGQAWVVFEDTVSATNALRQMQNFPFYEKPLKIEYARVQSDIVSIKKGTYVPREKKVRQKLAPKPKKETAKGDKMDVSTNHNTKPQSTYHPPKSSGPIQPSNILFATSLPQEVTKEMLILLFQQYPGYLEVRMVPNQGIAFIEFQEEMQASIALQGLSGFQLAPGQSLHLSYAKK
mmetsp:Transcript_19393/g.28708  ORF Transcript_19393/g.28708 Transcript_19393/m.28708 type:complete len:238 (-) Transcript_19393:23-736(-)